MSLMRPVLIGCVALLLAACGEEAPAPSVPVPAAPVPPAAESVKAVEIPAKQSAGGVTVDILPENPTSSGCLRAVIRGNPGRSAVVWKVNGEVVESGTGARFCSDHYRRGDQVTVEVGTIDQGARASVSIGNSPPQIVDIASEPAEIFAGVDVSVSPVAEDADGDDVIFSYQWLINDEADVLLTEATLPGSSFTKGDTIKVQIVPNDYYVDGPVYESYAMPIPNAPPQITSTPPQGITSLDYRYQVVVSDPDDSSFTYRLDEAPQGMTIDEQSGLIAWSLVDATPGDHTIAIVVTDPDGAEAAQEYTLSLSPAKQ